jgi:hypothetical protein
MRESAHALTPCGQTVNTTTENRTSLSTCVILCAERMLLRIWHVLPRLAGWHPSRHCLLTYQCENQCVVATDDEENLEKLYAELQERATRVEQATRSLTSRVPTHTHADPHAFKCTVFCRRTWISRRTWRSSSSSGPKCSGTHTCVLRYAYMQRTNNTHERQTYTMQHISRTSPTHNQGTAGQRAGDIYASGANPQHGARCKSSYSLCPTTSTTIFYCHCPPCGNTSSNTFAYASKIAPSATYSSNYCVSLPLLHTCTTTTNKYYCH